ncbi:hypothetical protein K7X08_023057 [Anisodus acutangulus]|uniref:MADS-box domain-containing protein n=1 Tax=Anisodus acutangulus TaxID=402998 RepID=A0A9Q1MF57_9SOLA|nr:hypothetical protein K7X08_023057 [Anisodus acutangulus]
MARNYIFPSALVVHMERKSSQTRKNDEIEFIKDKRAEGITISKMQKALCKKANELSILCGIEIAIIIFSIGGQPFLYGNPDVESVVNRFLEAKQPTASPFYMKKKRKVEENEDKGKSIEGNLKLTDLERFEKLNQEIGKLEDHLVEEIALLQNVIGSEDPKFVPDMNLTSSSTLPTNWLSL